MQFSSRHTIRTRLAYGIGGIPETIKNTAWDMFVLFYYSQVLGLSGSLTGLAIFISLAIDAISDPLTGMISDNLQNTRLGRRHTLMAASILPVLISIYFLFSPPADLSQLQLFAWLCCFAVLARVGITLYTIPYYAVGTELSRCPIERPTLMSFRTIIGNLSRFALIYIAFTFFFFSSEQFPNGQMNLSAYPPFGLTAALIIILTMVLAILGTYKPLLQLERMEARHTPTKISIGSFFRQTSQALKITPNVRWVILTTILFAMGLAVVNILTLHLSTYFWKLDSDSIKYMNMAMVPGTLAGAVVSRYWALKFEKKHIMYFGGCGFSLSLFLAIFLPLVNFFPEPGSVPTTYCLIGLKFCAGLCYGIFFIALASVTADVSDEHELQSGSPQQGLISGLSFFSLKLASGLVNIISGLTLDIIDFPLGKEVSSVSTEIINKLAVTTSFMIVFSGVAAMYCVHRFNISNTMQKELSNRLYDHKTRQTS
ncbi:MFS transporter [Haliea atlantica]